MCKNTLCLHKSMPHHDIKAFAWMRINPGTNNFYGTGNDMLGIMGTKHVKWVGDVNLYDMPRGFMNSRDQFIVINEKSMNEFTFNLVHTDRYTYYFMDSHTQTMVIRMARL